MTNWIGFLFTFVFPIVFFEVPSSRFVLYADRLLQQLATLAALRVALGLNAVTVVMRGDPHYP